MIFLRYGTGVLPLSWRTIHGKLIDRAAQQGVDDAGTGLAIAVRVGRLGRSAP
ncbi:hypothetical protein D3C75_1349860 [compost metagenome]